MRYGFINHTRLLNVLDALETAALRAEALACLVPKCFNATELVMKIRKTCFEKGWDAKSISSPSRAQGGSLSLIYLGGFWVPRSVLDPMISEAGVLSRVAHSRGRNSRQSGWVMARDLHAISGCGLARYHPSAGSWLGSLGKSRWRGLRSPSWVPQGGVGVWERWAWGAEGVYGGIRRT